MKFVFYMREREREQKGQTTYYHMKHSLKVETDSIEGNKKGAGQTKNCGEFDYRDRDQK